MKLQFEATLNLTIMLSDNVTQTCQQAEGVIIRRYHERALITLSSLYTRSRKSAIRSHIPTANSAMRTHLHEMSLCKSSILVFMDGVPNKEYEPE